MCAKERIGGPDMLKKMGTVVGMLLGVMLALVACTVDLEKEVELSVLIEPLNAGQVEIAGSVVVASGGATAVKKGDLINLTARANAGWAFDHWEDNITGTQASQALLMDSAKVVRAVFVAASGQPQSPQPTATPGTTTTVAPTAGVPSGPTVELMVLISPIDSGKVEIGGAEIPAGVANPIKTNDTIRLTARPANDSWEFDHWEGDVLESTEQQVSLRMDTIKNVRAVFKPSRPSDRLAAAFSAVPLSGTAPLTVSFEDASTGGPKEWTWDFDNNGSNDSTESHPVFTFQEAGTYTVRLRISRDDLIDTEVKVGLITVSKK